MKIINFIEDNNGKINANSLESLKASQEICKHNNGEIFCITFNSDVGEHLKQYNVKEVLLVQNNNLDDYSPLFFTKAVEQIINKIIPKHTQIVKPTTSIPIFLKTYLLRICCNSYIVIFNMFVKKTSAK